MAIAEELKLIIKTEVAKAQKDLQKYNKTAKDAKESNKKLGSSFKEMATVIGGVTAAFLILRKTAVAVFSATQIAAKQQQVGLALDNMARRAGLSTDSIVADMQKMSGETISEMDIMASASKAALLGIPLKEMAGLMQIARAAATAMGKDTGQMFDDLGTGIGRQSKVILDNLGLWVSVEEAQKDYADSVGKTSAQLTDAEMRQAFLNATLKDGARIMDMVGQAGQGMTPLEPVQQFRTAVSDLTATLGGLFLPTVNKAASGLAVFIQAIQDAIEEAKEYKAALRAIAGAAEAGIAAPAVAMIIKLEAELAPLNEEFVETRRLMTEAAEAGAKWSDIIDRFQPILERLSPEIDRITGAIARYQFELDQMAEVEKIANEEREKAIALQIALKSGLNLYNMALTATLTEEEKQIKAYEDIVSGLRDYRDNLLLTEIANWDHFNSVAGLITEYTQLLALLGGGVDQPPGEREIVQVASIMKHELEGIRDKAREVAEQMGLHPALIELAMREAEEDRPTFHGGGVDQPLGEREIVQVASIMKRELAGISDKAREIAEQMGLNPALIELAIREGEKFNKTIDQTNNAAEALAEQLKKASEAMEFEKKLEEIRKIGDALDIAGQAAFNMAGAMVDMFQGEGLESFKDAVKNTLVSILQMYSKLHAALAISALIPGPTFNPVAVPGHIAASVALMAGAGVIASLKEGGITTKPTLAMLHKNEAIIPLDKPGRSIGNTIIQNFNIQGSVISERELKGLAIEAYGEVSRGF